MDFGYCYSLEQLISVPTRITESTATLIDHVLTNSSHNIIQSGVIEMSLSDHALIYCTQKTTKLESKKHNKLNIRTMKNYIAENFIELLNKIDFSSYQTFSCENKVYLDFITKLLTVIDTLCPSKKIRINGNIKAWFDSEVIALINKRGGYSKKFTSSGLDTDKDLLKAAKISLKNIIEKSKKTLFQDKLKENSNSSKELWKTLKSLGMNSKSLNQLKICLKDNGVTQFDPKKNANIFKTFYSELAGNLVKMFPKPSLKFNTNKTMMFYKKSNPNLEKFELVCITEETIKKLLCCLDVSKAPGIDEISDRFLKDGAEVLAKPICDFINLSIKRSTFPDKCKIAKLTPLFKKGFKTGPKNYRPISLLSLVSTLTEKTSIYKRRST